MLATREIPVSTSPCRSPFCNDLGGEGDYYYNARWYDAGTGRFISEDPARDGQNWFNYVSNNPLKFVDPTGMRRVDGDSADDERDREQRNTEYEKKKSDRKDRRDAQGREDRRNDLKDKKDDLINSGMDNDRNIDRLNEQIQAVEDEIMDNITEAAYDEISETVDEILNNGLAETAKSFVGGNYHSGGETPSPEGQGLDCSSTSMISAETVSGVGIGDRTADEMANDPNLLKPGNGGVGSQNFYDWDGDGVYDHVTTVTEAGEVHPSSNAGKINMVENGFLDQYAKKKINKNYNWGYILWD